MGNALYREDDGRRNALPEAVENTSGIEEHVASHSRRSGTAWSTGHPVSIRVSVPSPFGRFYLTVVAGRERRSAGRLGSERLKHPLITAGNICLLAAVSTIVGLGVHGALQLATLHLLQQSGIVVVP